MITLNFSLWELAILIVGLAFVVGAVYLVKTLKSVARTFDATTALLEENRQALHSIIENADEITKSSTQIMSRANEVTDEVVVVLDSFKQDVIDPLTKAASMFTKGFRLFQSNKKKVKG